MKTLEYVFLTCSKCGRQARLDATLLESRFNLSLTTHSVGRLYRRLCCRDCGSRDVRIEDEARQVLIDPNKIVLCQACGHPIPLPRIEVMPEVELCVPCAEDRAKPSPVPPWPQPPANKGRCPRCGSLTEVRMNSKDESYFLGCSSYPKCRWTDGLDG